MEEYKGLGPACFKCKKPINPNDDYYVLTWKGKTWAMEANYHINCLIQAVKNEDIKAYPPDE
jgi:hypothetical protein